MADRIDSVSAAYVRMSKYPWGTWTDGSAWRLHQGEDFEVSPYHMGQSVRQHAKRHGIPVQVRINTAAGIVEFQFLNQQETETAA